MYKKEAPPPKKKKVKTHLKSMKYSENFISKIKVDNIT